MAVTNVSKLNSRPVTILLKKVYIRKEGKGPSHLESKGITTEYDVTDCEDFGKEHIYVGS